MFYYKPNQCAVRRKFGDKTQIWQFGGKTCGLDSDTLKGFGEDCLKKLDAGNKEEVVYEWVKHAIRGEKLW